MVSWTLQTLPGSHLHSRKQVSCATLESKRQRCRARVQLLLCRADAQQGDTNVSDSQSSGRDAVLSRIQKAKQYKQELVSKNNAAEKSTPPSAPEVVTKFLQQADVYARKQEEAFLQAQNDIAKSSKKLSTDNSTPMSPASGSNTQQSLATAQKASSGGRQLSASQLDVNATARTIGTGMGSATDAANYLKTVSTNNAADLLDNNLRPEEYTLRKEELNKQREVEIISIDKNYKPDSGKYKPKVATWGVFPRPDNISKAFGGGRNIRPGQAYESEEEAEALKKRVAAALSRYKTQAGLVLEPEVEAASQAAYDAGMKLFDLGRLELALEKFSESSDMVNDRTRIGGQALLQKAICLDSLGRNDEAYVIYQRIARHSAPGVAKSAKRMIFGFQAMKSLKTHTISYSVNKGAYEQYFRRISSDWNTAYFSSDEDTNLASQYVSASAVILTPLLLLAVKVWLL